MKINSIGSVCKSNKTVIIWQQRNEDGEVVAQYIGNGCAFYAIHDMPALTKENALMIFGIPEKNWGKWIARCDELPEHFDFGDTGAQDKPIDEIGITLVYGDAVLKPFMTSQGIVFVDHRYMSPIADDMNVIEFYERPTSGGYPLIVAKAGMLFQVAISPYDPICRRFVADLRRLADECAAEEERRMRAGEEMAEGQLSEPESGAGAW